MIKRLLILAAIFTPFALYRHFGDFMLPVTQRNEAWLESSVPVEFGQYSLVKGDAGDRVSYKMDETTYKTLSPVGIAGQVFSDQSGGRYDAVVIAGLGMHSFHDQRWCFQAQGFTILEDKQSTIKTKAYGDVDILSLTIKRDGRPSQPALFVFKSPERFSANYYAAKWDFLKKQLLTGTPHMGFSFRFIGMTEDVTKEELITFAQQYLDEIHTQSKGEV